MKRLACLTLSVILMATLCVPSAFSQSSGTNDGQEEIYKKERRIFLWDVTISMVGATRDSSFPKAKKRTGVPRYDYNEGFPNYNPSKDVFDKTRETLIQLIMGINNESTEIIVLPFRNGIVGEFKANATSDGKKALRDKVMNWDDLRSGGTFTATCLEDAVNRYFTRDRINRVVLLTDGEPSDNERPRLLSYLANWKGVKETKGSGAYLTYVMLTDEAAGISSDIRILADKEENMDVIGPDEDILEQISMSIGHDASIHVRDFFDGKVSTNGSGTFDVTYRIDSGNDLPEGSTFHFSIEDNPYVEIDSSFSVKATAGKMTVPFKMKESLEDLLVELPHNVDTVLTVLCEAEPEPKNLHLLGNREVYLTLVLKPEPRATIRWSTK